MKLTSQAIVSITDGDSLTVAKSVSSPIVDVDDFVYESVVLVPAGTTNQQIELGLIATTSHILISTSTDPVSIKLGGTGSTAIPITTYLSVTTATDKIYVSNAGAQPVNLFVCVSGLKA